LKTQIIGLQSQRLPRARSAVKDKGVDLARIYVGVVERYAKLFDRPEVRLRFLNTTLAKQAERQRSLQDAFTHLQFLKGTRLYKLLLKARLYIALVEELRNLAPQMAGGRRKLLRRFEMPLSMRCIFLIYQTRHAFYAMGVLVSGMMLLGAYSLASLSARHVNNYLEQKYQRGSAGVTQTAMPPNGSGTALAGTGAKYLPGYKADRVWVVEENDDVERYSNGARILRKYEIHNYPRGYYRIPRGSESDDDRVRRDVVGIVYHTSESVIVPFTADNNTSIQKRSQWLLEYIRSKKSYNYLIDRYGEIFRVVRDDHAAYHSGHSIWADNNYIYVGLNESFIGICFESSVAGDSPEETLTEGQIISGRRLTNVLRSIYNIDDANCTTHGLVSVNPKKMLIAFHHDWVRTFPFDAMGLSDKYRVKPPNVTEYGFTYDDETLAKVGELWEGALTADKEFKERAGNLRVDPATLRSKLRDRYSAQIEKIRRIRLKQDETDKSSLAAQSSISSSSAERGNE
jgi:N-acetylmuramoyl-L-alanine amidase